jgi:hypothetical protein
MTELSRETRSLLECGRFGTPLTAAHRARLKSAILAKATGVAIAATTSKAAAWMSLGVKIGGALAIVAAVGGAVGAKLEIESKRALSSPMPLATKSTAVVDRGRPASTPSPSTMPPAIVVPDGDTIAMAGWFAPRPAAPRTDPANTILTSPATRPVLQAARSPVLAPVGRAVAAANAPIIRETSVQAPVVVATSGAPTPGAAPTSTVGPRLASDVRLLRDADLAIRRGDPDRALELLDEHAVTFPKSDLEPERSAERVFALCRAGRLEESRNAAGRFLSAHPTGPLAARVKSACRGGSL